jgi:tetratricopeptide (TPR) repeat protein
MKRRLGFLITAVCLSCAASDQPRRAAQPDAAELAAAEANPVYRQHRRHFKALFESGDHPAALDEAKKALAAAPVLREPYTWVSTLCNQLGRNQEAILLFRETTEAHPTLALPWFYKGFNEFHLSLFEDALASFERAAELNPEDPQTWYRRGIIYYGESDFEAALRMLEESRRLDPTSEPTISALIDVLRIMGKEERATEVVLEALTEFPDSAAILFRKGLIDVGRRDDASAEIAFRRAVELDPSLLEPHEQLAGLYQRTGRDEESRYHDNISSRLNDYTRHSMLLHGRLVDAVDGAIPLLLAEVELTDGKAEVAIRWFQRAMQLRGYAERNAAGQAEALFRQGRIEQGDRLIAAAKPGSSRALLARVAREIALNNPLLARENLDRALQRAPNEAQFLRRASDYARDLGDTERSVQLLARSIDAETLSSAPDPD